MSEYKRLKPIDEVKKLKKWGPGRLAQLKTFIAHLDSAFSSSLAAQVSQSSKRVFSEFVPKVVSQNIEVEIEFREIRVQFDVPRGTRNFLFYEAQVSLFENFAQVTQFISNDPHFVFSNLLDGVTYYIRVRQVTKDKLFGPWSDTVSGFTPFSQSFGLFDGTEVESSISYRDNDFVTIFSKDYNAIGGNAYYSIEYEVETLIEGPSSTITYYPDNPSFPSGITSNNENLEWSDIEFQWILDDKQVGQNFLVTTYATTNLSSLGNFLVATNTADGDANLTGSLSIPGTFSFARRGSFVQKFIELSEGDHTIKLNARVADHLGRNDWVFNAASTIVKHGAGATIRLKNFNIFEALTT